MFLLEMWTLPTTSRGYTPTVGTWVARFLSIREQSHPRPHSKDALPVPVAPAVSRLVAVQRDSQKAVLADQPSPGRYWVAVTLPSTGSSVRP